LRSRSFYLEMFIEHAMDLVFQELGLSRANLLYSGGGHAYALLPNCESVEKAAKSVFEGINRWLRGKFGTSLYFAFAAVPCSAFDLMNKPSHGAPLPKLYMNLSRKLAEKKLRRYDFEDIKALNSGNLPDNSGRECKTCGKATDLRDDEDICTICGSLQDMSNELIREEKLLLVTSKQLEDKTGIVLPSSSGHDDCFMYAVDEGFARECLKAGHDEVMGIYGKNHLYTGLKLSTKIWMGDYYARSAEQEKDSNSLSAATFEELAERSAGIKRLGVLRADVDSLGEAFISGFARRDEKDLEKKFKFETISRKVTFSRMLSLFFKLYINCILRDGPGGNLAPFRLDERKQWKSREVNIVYSGGDDIFLVGAWDEVLEAAVDMRRAFSIFCGASLTFSAGFGIFGDSYPVSRMALEVAELE
ncbi:MAG: type III-A CRISPR-associated protein Cas10/Csm1, partial [Oscillospiraceae bacterium]|nr:type III-A CRISPR-associated protein Cas10/Csm1 [Oscillospiraceae bacterium]